ncbi:tetraacyldisaccharide 4'-kinase [Endozoicomonas sp. SM1973]|uniref:Tetraacyldisaccharide 4'-kinase n=1 Tax=Spartinivicinus marinus TaxID=2994442 RepID=A0A853I5Z4_9GAMM|nr:tetraacyldisaccharide 4'-kinase [Spartinivicinus marinus]MCX4029423.1 tetraacyldisaccharide 4'-kinase [Spartinivicinus marinus]NYZ64997.1 tetraacyldisaccharide 4'-kinase [Spartinivicinus marinus]
MNWLVNAWYQPDRQLRWLMPLRLLYQQVIRHKRQRFLSGAEPAWQAPVPVIVVGNITVGGTGKTPLVTAMIEQLKGWGCTPGIISRGYGGKSSYYPLAVTPDSDPSVAGDEPVMLAQLTGVPVMVAPQRVAAAKGLLNQFPETDIIVADDGLQHYPLGRDIELVVIDGARGLGNGYCLPQGPLREPPGRLKTVDFVVVNGDAPLVAITEPQQLMALVPECLVQVSSGEKRPLTRGSLDDFKQVHGVAGIGNPARFFATCESLGMQVIPHPKDDHAQLTAKDVQFDDQLPVLMTSKDAVKCRSFATAKHWSLLVAAKLPESFWRQLKEKVKQAQSKKVNQ